MSADHPKAGPSNTAQRTHLSAPRKKHRRITCGPGDEHALGLGHSCCKRPPEAEGGTCALRAGRTLAAAAVTRIEYVSLGGCCAIGLNTLRCALGSEVAHTQVLHLLLCSRIASMSAVTLKTCCPYKHPKHCFLDNSRHPMAFSLIQSLLPPCR